MSIIANKTTSISRDEKIVLNWVNNNKALDNEESLLFRRIAKNIELLSKNEVSLLARLITDKTSISNAQSSLLNVVIKNKSL